MSVTPNSMVSWCRKLLGADPSCPKLPLEQYLKAIPRMECLGKLPSGTPVLDPRRRRRQAGRQRSARATSACGR